MKLSCKIAAVTVMGLALVVAALGLAGRCSPGVAGLLLASGAVVAGGASYWLAGRPLRTLAAGAGRLLGGEPVRRERRGRHDEVGELAAQLDRMRDRLAAANELLTTEVSQRTSAVEALRHADRLTTVGQLAAGIAHELGTPLNVISGRAKMITRGDLPPAEAVDCARIVVEQAERIDRIIRQLLDFARRRTPQKSAQDLRPVIEKTLELLTPMAQKRSVALRLADPPAAPVVVEIDGSQIQQVVTNLVVNGIQAMTGGGTLTVRLARRRATPPRDHGGPEGHYAAIAVRDEGIGVPPEVLEHLFEPFFTTKGVGEGTGLGLPVSYGIVREHGGWIAVDSKPGQGSCFTVYLP